MGTYSSILACKILWTVHGVSESDTTEQLSLHTIMNSKPVVLLCRALVKRALKLHSFTHYVTERPGIEVLWV